MIREHIRHIRTTVDDQSIAIRLGVTGAAILSLPLLGTGVKTIGTMLSLGAGTIPLLVMAHVPVVIALFAIWSIGCDVCR